MLRCRQLCFYLGSIFCLAFFSSLIYAQQPPKTLVKLCFFSEVANDDGQVSVSHTTKTGDVWRLPLTYSKENGQFYLRQDEKQSQLLRLANFLARDDWGFNFPSLVRSDIKVAVEAVFKSYKLTAEQLKHLKITSYYEFSGKKLLSVKHVDDSDGLTQVVSRLFAFSFDVERKTCQLNRVANLDKNKKLMNKIFFHWHDTGAGENSRWDNIHVENSRSLGRTIFTFY